MLSVNQCFPTIFIWGCHCFFIPLFLFHWYSQYHFQFLLPHIHVLDLPSIHQETNSSFIHSCESCLTNFFNKACWGSTDPARCHHCSYSRCRTILLFFMVTNWLVLQFFLIICCRILGLTALNSLLQYVN